MQVKSQGEHSVILSTFIKLPFVIEIFVASIFACQFYIGFSVLCVFSDSILVFPDSVTLSFDFFSFLFTRVTMLLLCFYTFLFRVCYSFF